MSDSSAQPKKITSRIVGYSVKEAGAAEPAAPAAPPAPESSIQQMNETISRPELLVGSTYKIKPAGSDHALYITINDIILNEGTDHEQRRPYEIFINSKNMEQFQWVVALTRILSAVFRKGGDVNFLVDELKAVFDPRGGYWKPGTGLYVPSVIAEIGMAIEDHFKRIGLIKSEMDAATLALIADKRKQYEAKTATAPTAANDGGFPPSATMCNKCNTKAVVIMDGCATCLNCGNSKCG